VYTNHTHQGKHTMNKFRVDTNNTKSAPCGMNNIRYIGDSASAARRAFDNSTIGIDAWGKVDPAYGIVMTKWSEKKGEYLVIDSKGL